LLLCGSNPAFHLLQSQALGVFLEVEAESSGDAMNEAGGQETQETLNPGKQGRKIPFLIKAIFWDKPLSLLTFSLLMMGMFSPLVFLMIHAARDGRLERLEKLGLPILMMILSFPALFLCVFVVTVVILLRRKLRTGSFLLSREKLDVNVARSLKPQSLRKRIILAAIYWFIAIDETYVAATTQHHSQFKWGFAAFLWLVTAFFTVDVFRPFGRKSALPVTTEGPQPSPNAENR
jgi:hypothetical protein